MLKKKHEIVKNHQASQLSRRIQERRMQMGLSLRELAARAGVTASFLSQVERGQSNPSLKTLQAIARTLNVPIFYLLVDDSSENHHLVRRGEGTRSAFATPNVSLEVFSPSPEAQRKMLAFVARFQPGYSEETVPSQQPTEECIIVLSGALLIDLKDGSHILQTGDSITFDGMNIRRLTALNHEEVVYLSFSTPPYV